MTDLPEKLRGLLEGRLAMGRMSPVQTVRSTDGNTTKYLFVTDDGEGIESVALEDGRGRTSFCISSQVGCEVGCVYCATGRWGLRRDLTAGEILSQVLALEKLHGRPDSVLYMGMGEPLLNLRAVEKSLRILDASGYSARNVTLSTCGVVGGIYRIADSGLKPRLAVSVGSPLQKKRDTLIPHGAAGSLEEIESAVKHYLEKTRRRVTYEYTLMEGVNDSEEEGRELGRLARRSGAHVNVIRCNPREIGGPRAPGKEKVNRFKEWIAREGAGVTERYRRGADIGAACGQLVPLTGPRAGGGKKNGA
jgi:23S rRNA (adenine2503-C2)-methyltransferase